MRSKRSSKGLAQTLKLFGFLFGFPKPPKLSFVDFKSFKSSLARLGPSLAGRQPFAVQNAARK